MASAGQDRTPTGTSRAARHRFSSRRRLSFDEGPHDASTSGQSSQPHFSHASSQTHSGGQVHSSSQPRSSNQPRSNSRTRSINQPRSSPPRSSEQLHSSSQPRSSSSSGQSRSSDQPHSRSRLYSSGQPHSSNSQSNSQPHASGTDPWSDEETRALLEFLLFYKGPGVLWFPQGASNQFWVACATFVKEKARTHNLRSGKPILF